MDIGIKIKNRAANNHFGPACKWNAMVTDRVRLTSAGDLDKEVIEWLQAAFLQISGKRK